MQPLAIGEGPAAAAALGARGGFAGGPLSRATAPAVLPRAAPRRAHFGVTAAIKVCSKRSIVKTAVLHADEGKADAVRTLCAEHLKAVLAAKAKNKKSGVVTYDVHEDPFEAGTFHFWERYDSVSAMATHNSSEAQQAFEAKVTPLLRDGIGMSLFEWSDGKLGVAAMPIGPKGEGGLDDASGQNGGAGGGAGYEQTSATVDLGHVKRDEGGDAFGLKAALALFGRTLKGTMGSKDATGAR